MPELKTRASKPVRLVPKATTTISPRLATLLTKVKKVKKDAKVVGLKNPTTKQGTGDNVIRVGVEPENYGAHFSWGRMNPESLLVLHLSASDADGVHILGAMPGDLVEILYADGFCSFSEDTKNKYSGGIISLVAAGAKIGVSAAGFPAAAPLIGLGETFAKEMFAPEKVKTKRRDPFGEDPGTGHKAKQEGGVLICLPEAGQVYSSGNADHRERWIQGDGVRSYKNMPKHVKHGLFLQPGGGPNNRIFIKSEGVLVFIPWDHKFEDNCGSYKLFIKLWRKDSVPKSYFPDIQ